MPFPASSLPGHPPITLNKGGGIAMYRVVCPVCKAGFEARFTRNNCAINCVTCGVAFNASSYLPKSDGSRMKADERYTGPVLIDPPADGTRTGGLPFPLEG